MKRQSGRGAFASIFLTFSLLLLVLALGFVLGRVLVGRVSVKRAPEFPRQAAKSAMPGETAPGESRPQTQVYVPQPQAEGQPEAGSDTPSEKPPPQTPAPGPETVEPPAPTAAPTEEGTGEGKYSVQVGLFVAQPGARELTDELARAGYPARIEVQKEGSRITYRVVTGHYLTEYAARKAADQLTQEGFPAFMVKQ